MANAPVSPFLSHTFHVFYSFIPIHLRTATPRCLTPSSYEQFAIRPADWAQHGICGRGVFLDLVKYYTDIHGRLPYDPITTHGIPAADLVACAKAQGVTFRPADILILRVGFMQRFHGATQEERDDLADRQETL